MPKGSSQVGFEAVNDRDVITLHLGQIWELGNRKNGWRKSEFLGGAWYNTRL